MIQADREKFTHGLTLLSQGDYKRGFELYEHRGSPSPRIAFLRKTIAFWDGKPTDKPLMIWHEGGFGDTLQMARFLPNVAKLASNLIVSVMPTMISLLQSSGLPGRIVDRVEVTEIISGQQCSFMSLPYQLGLTLNELSDEPYLKPSRDAVDVWAAKLKGQPRIGLCSAGRTWFLPEFVSQYLEKRIEVLSLHPQSTGANDWMDTAAIVANLDAIITIDTSIAHLAGAMGKPTFILLPYEAEWRWLRDRSDSPWYKNTRLFRCLEPGDWQTPIDAVIKAVSS